MKLHSHKNNRKKVQRFLSVLLILCLVFSEGSRQIAVAGADNGGNEGHQHDDGCYEEVIDTTADVEDAAMWDAMFKDVEWQDSWGEDLVTAARMQLGYRESARNYAVMENKSHKGYTRYGQFAGEPYAEWDAAFVNFCLRYAGLAEHGIFPDELDAAKWQEAFLGMDEKNAEFLTEPQGYVPAAGDIVFFERIVEIKPMETEAPEETEKPTEPEAPAEETEKPAGTEAPVEGTEKPAGTEAPVEGTEKPAGTEAPVEGTGEPAGTEAPVEGTGKPAGTEAPVEGTEEPAGTEAPVEGTEEPAGTEAPAEGTEEPAGTEAPAEGTEEPAGTEAPAEETEEPAAQAEAEESGEPEARSETGASVENEEAENAEESAIVELSETIEGTEGEEAAEPLTERRIMMGIVSSYDAETNTITVIEGDYDDEVKENTYNVSNIEGSGMKAYLMMTKLEKHVRINEIRTLSVEGKDYTVTVRFTLEAFPEDVTLEVKEIEKGSKEYQDCYDQAMEALGTTEDLEFARYFDLTFLVDGKEVEPQAPVNVVITCEDLKDADTGINAEDIKVVHIGAEETSVVEGASVDEQQQVSFDSDAFSIYAIVIVLGEPGELIYEGEGFTIKVSYGADARLPKGTEMTIRELEKGSDEYKEYFERSEKALNLEGDEISGEDITLEQQFAYLFGGGLVVEDARIYDIELSYDGKKIEPAAPVNVEIHYDEEGVPEALSAEAAEDAEDAEDAEVAENTKVVHFADDGTEVISDVEVETSEDGVTISYQQGSFSTTAITMAKTFGNGGWWYTTPFNANTPTYRMRFRYINGSFELGYPGNFYATGTKDNADWSWPGDPGYPTSVTGAGEVKLKEGTTIEQILRALAQYGDSTYCSQVGGVDFMMCDTYTVDDSNWEANGKRAISNGYGAQETEVWTGEFHGSWNIGGAQTDTNKPATGAWKMKSISINRASDFEGPLIHIKSDGSHPVHARTNVVINNGGVDKTAVLIEDKALLMMESNAYIECGGNGTGVYLDKGGSVEFFDQSYVTHATVAVEQKNGKTRLKNSPDPFGTGKGNETGVALWPGQSIGKWTDNLPDNMSPVPILLRDLDQWKSGDIVMDSGRWWYDEKYSGPHNEMYGAVVSTDLGSNKFYFQNPQDGVNMALEYYDGPMGDGHYTSSTVTNQGGTKPMVPAGEKYPVIRFTRGTVYNANTNTWYKTLYDAVNNENNMGPGTSPRKVQSGDTLIFFGSTVEDKTVTIPGNVQNLTIRTSNTDDLSTADNRKGDACTAEINAGIVIQSGASVTFQGGGEGGLTLAGGADVTTITNNGTLNLENGVTLSGAKYAVEQNGTFNLYEGVTFSENKTADVLLGERVDGDEGKYITLQTANPTTNVSVALETGDKKQFHGRDVVVQGNDEVNLNEAFLAKFPLKDKGEDFTYIFKNDGGPNQAPVLELKEAGKAMIKIIKVNMHDHDIKIEGAQFKIEAIEVDGKTGKFDGDATRLTSQDGEISYAVKVGKYTITETQAAPGYKLGENVTYTFTVEAGTDEDTFVVKDANGEVSKEITSTDGGKTFSITIENEVVPYELPSTGGRGTYWYSVGGTLLMMAGVLILYRNKRKRVRRCRRA